MNKKILEGYDKYVLFGAHEVGVRALIHLQSENVEVAYFCDTDSKKWGISIEGIDIIPPDELPEYVARENALVIICTANSKHLDAIQLDKMNVPYIYYTKPIYVEITSFCNQACIFCVSEHIKREKTNLNPQLMKDFLHEIKSENSDILYPTIYPHVLGEPFVSKHFFEFMDICKELGFYVCLVTNWALINRDIQQRLFSEYPEFDIIFSMQGATKKVYEWRKEKRLTFEQWIDLLFEILESKFKYAHKGLVRICTLFPDVVNNYLIQSNTDIKLFQWYENDEEFKSWKREFGGRCVAFDKEMRLKYPKNYKIISAAVSPVPHKYNMYTPTTNLAVWIEADATLQFLFAPNVIIYGKTFGVWATDIFLRDLLPDDQYVYYEENWYAKTASCDRVGDVALLSDGSLVVCNVDTEADYVIANINAGEKYTDTRTQTHLRELRENLTLSSLCRRCKGRILVFDTAESCATEQEIIHYGSRWNSKKDKTSGEQNRVSCEISNAYAYPRIDANSVEIDMASVQNRKQFSLIKILSYDNVNESFTERKLYSIQLNPGERIKLSIPYQFSKRTLHRIDIITATHRIDDIDSGVAVYSMRLRNQYA